MKNNSAPSIGVLQQPNVIYQFKCPLGYCISENNNIRGAFNKLLGFFFVKALKIVVDT